MPAWPTVYRRGTGRSKAERGFHFGCFGLAHDAFVTLRDDMFQLTSADLLTGNV